MAVMRTWVGTAVVLASLALPSMVGAQTTDKWSPWIGCWTLTTENLLEGRGSARASALSTPQERQQPDDSTPRTCVARSGDGVTMTTTVPGQTPLTQTIVADGSPHDIVDGECHGVERTTWSNNGTRLLGHADVTCADQSSRTLAGLGLITRHGEWLDIRNVQIDGRGVTRVSRYHRTSGVSVYGQPLTIGEIKELSAKVAPLVLEAAVAETHPDLTVNRHVLLDLADAQVPSNVIDVVVALAYPDKFVVEKPFNPDAMLTAPASGGGGGSISADPFFYDPYWYGYYYSPFAYGYLGGYYPPFYGGYYPPIYGGGRPGGGVPIGGGGGSTTPVETGQARAINGQGYTRIHPADGAEPRAVQSATGGTRSVVTASSGSSSNSGSSGSSAPAPAPSSDSGSSSGGGGTASPQGFSGGGGDSGGGGRTAVPR
jgi:hypothetical protein